MKKGNVIALLPIGIFLVLYLGVGILFEYVMKIPMGFYSVPVVVIFMVALFVAVLQTKGQPLDKKFEIMSRGVGDKNIITMLLIFMLAGIFVGVAGRSSAESVAYFMLSVTPPRLAVVVLFLVSCFVSTAMGTSVGTITLITPIAVAVAEGSGFSLPLCVGTVSLPFAIDALRHGESKRKNTLMLLIALLVIVLSTLLLWELRASWSQGYEITFM